MFLLAVIGAAATVSAVVHYVSFQKHAAHEWRLTQLEKQQHEHKCK
jgi:hypothetical protein